jgi:hypothetical protein
VIAFNRVKGQGSIGTRLEFRSAQSCQYLKANEWRRCFMNLGSIDVMDLDRTPVASRCLRIKLYFDENFP